MHLANMSQNCSIWRHMAVRLNETAKIGPKTILLKLPPLQYLGAPVDGVRLFWGGLVLAVDLDTFVGLRRDQTRAGTVEGHREDSGLGVHRARLDCRLGKENAR